MVAKSHTLHRMCFEQQCQASLAIASFPGPIQKIEKGSGNEAIHRMCMFQTAMPGLISYATVCSLFLWDSVSLTYQQSFGSEWGCLFYRSIWQKCFPESPQLPACAPDNSWLSLAGQSVSDIPATNSTQRSLQITTYSYVIACSVQMILSPNLCSACLQLSLIR